MIFAAVGLLNVKKRCSVKGRRNKNNTQNKIAVIIKRAQKKFFLMVAFTNAAINYY